MSKFHSHLSGAAKAQHDDYFGRDIELIDPDDPGTQIAATAAVGNVKIETVTRDGRELRIQRRRVRFITPATVAKNFLVRIDAVDWKFDGSTTGEASGQAFQLVRADAHEVARPQYRK